MKVLKRGDKVPASGIYRVPHLLPHTLNCGICTSRETIFRRAEFVSRVSAIDWNHFAFQWRRGRSHNWRPLFANDQLGAIHVRTKQATTARLELTP